MKTLEVIHRQTIERLKQFNIENPALDSRLLLSHCYDLTPETFVLRKFDLFDEEQVKKSIDRRCQAEPLSKILGYKEFWSRCFQTNEFTLDPRADSEAIIETVLKLLPVNEKTYRFLDLGTGTGCLLQTLLLEYPHATGVGVDISERALDVAKGNAVKHDLMKRSDWCLGSWADCSLENIGLFDVVVSNPPYISKEEMEELSLDVKNHDPHLALYGGVDGLDCYRNIVTLLPKLLKPQGWIIFEVGYRQAQEVEKMLFDSSMKNLGMTRDFSGIERCVFGQKI